MNTITTFYFKHDLRYLDFITEATKLLHYNTLLETVCIPVAHIMWNSYKIKQRDIKYKYVAVTITPKEVAELKTPGLTYYWILHEHTRKISSCVASDCNNINKVASRALTQIRKSSIILPTDFDFTLVPTSKNPESALSSATTFKSTKVSLFD